MAWYDSYLSAYNVPLSAVPTDIVAKVKDGVAKHRSSSEVSVVAIAHNEAERITACLWSLVENITYHDYELIVVNNCSTDDTEEVLRALGVTYYNEGRKGPGHARQCGLDHAGGKYYLCIDADTLYPPYYIDTMVAALGGDGVVCAYGLWSFLPAEGYSRFSMALYEGLRDIYLRLQNLRRPELNVRGMVFAFITDEGRKCGFRTDIIRGEDGSLALALKGSGRLSFVTSRKARAVTGYGTLSADGSLLRAFAARLRKGLSSVTSLFTRRTEYADEADNLLQEPSVGRPLRLVYCTPALYMAGGVERVLTMKANHLAEVYGYDITIILTEGAGREPFYPLSPKVKVINLDIGFEELWHCGFFKKVFIYLRKQRHYRRALAATLLRLRPDITISLLRREINFLTGIKDGSRKVGELHVNRTNYRNFEGGNAAQRLFSAWWMGILVTKLKRLDRFIVLTEEDKAAWKELDNVMVIPNPLTIEVKSSAQPTARRLLAVGRYSYQKGFDLLLETWHRIEGEHPDWALAVYGFGDREPYIRQAEALGIDMSRCHLNPATRDIAAEYAASGIYVLSSRFEGFGLVLVEAMASGLPVVSFDCPAGPKDIITEGSGLLVPSGDVAALAATLSSLMGDEAQRKALSVAARKRASHFDISSIGAKWHSLFESIAR